MNMCRNMQMYWNYSILKSSDCIAVLIKGVIRVCATKVLRRYYLEERYKNKRTMFCCLVKRKKTSWDFFCAW